MFRIFIFLGIIYVGFSQPMPTIPVFKKTIKPTLSPRLSESTGKQMRNGQNTNRISVLSSSTLLNGTNWQVFTTMLETAAATMVNVIVTNQPAPPKTQVLVSWKTPGNLLVSSNLVDWHPKLFSISCSVASSNSNSAQFFRVPMGSSGLSVMLSWDDSASPETVSYRIYYGIKSKTYTNSISVSKEQRFVTIDGLLFGTTYYFAATASNSNGDESEFSNEVNCTLPEEDATAQIKMF